METVTLESGEVISKEFYDKLMSVTKRRPRIVIDILMKKGSCSTEDLKDIGYEHAPRAKRDVVEEGIPVITTFGKDREGHRMAIYKLGDWEQYKLNDSLAKTNGRSNFSNELKKKLISEYGSRCFLYNEPYKASLLQIDHRIPYEIGGDPNDMMDTSKFMLLSPSANRAKSWACEHCPNWVTKNINTCRTCYYAYPENYSHVACHPERRITLSFRTKQEVELYNKLEHESDKNNASLQKIVKSILENR